MTPGRPAQALAGRLPAPRRAVHRRPGPVACSAEAVEPGGASGPVQDTPGTAGLPPGEAPAEARGRPAARVGTRCWLIWGALLLLPVLLALGIALPWWQQMRTLDEALATTRDQLERLTRLVGTLPTLRAELAREQANQDFKAFYFDATTPALAGAQIQREVQEMVGAVGARLISAQVLPTDPAERPPRVPLRIQLQATTEQLLEVLYRIEETRPFLFVDQLSVRSTAQPGQPGQPGPQPRGRPTARLPNAPPPGDLTVRIDLFGFVLKPGDAAAAGAQP